MSPMTNKLRIRLVIGAVLVTLLLAAVFTLGSLDVPIEPSSWREIIALYSLSSLITAALLVFGLILTRTIVRLWTERGKQQLGARFKTKMVLGAMAISLLPVIFMFFVSYSLLNRTLGRWFPRPLEIASEETQKLLNDLGQSTLPRLHTQGYQAAMHASETPESFLAKALSTGLDAVWLYDAEGTFLRGGVICEDQPEDRSLATCTVAGVQGKLVRPLPSGVEIWEANGQNYFTARVPAMLDGQKPGTLIAGYRTSPDFLKRWAIIQAQTKEYDNVKQNLRALKRQMLLILFFFTILVLSAATWVALYLSKQVTVPIQALAEGTREVSAGNFAYQVPDQVQDELGLLVRSFNTMTTQLSDSRSQIDEFTRNSAASRAGIGATTAVDGNGAGEYSCGRDFTGRQRLDPANEHGAAAYVWNRGTRNSVAGIASRSGGAPHGAGIDAASAAHGPGLERNGSRGGGRDIAPGRNGQRVGAAPRE